MFNKYRPEDYKQRLDNTIVCYNGYPVLLSVISSKTFTVAPLSAECEFEAKNILSSDPLLDLSTPPLGYFQYKDTAMFISRNPVRKYMQGLKVNSGNYGAWMLVNGFHNDAPQTIVMTSGFENLVLDRYPPIDECLALLKGFKSIAVSRNIAICKNKDAYIVYFKKEEVGWIKPGTRVVKVPREVDSWIISKYLSELSWEVD